jgi:hypothetical protein
VADRTTGLKIGLGLGVGRLFCGLIDLIENGAFRFHAGSLACHALAGETLPAMFPHHRGAKMFEIPWASRSPAATPAAICPALRRKLPRPLFAANGLDCTGAPIGPAQ